MGASVFEVVEFKLKSQSEHTVDGEHYDLELQIYCRGKQDEVAIGPRQQHKDPAVISILMDTTRFTEGAADSKNTVGNFLEDLRESASEIYSD